MKKVAILFTLVLVFCAAAPAFAAPAQRQEGLKPCAIDGVGTCFIPSEISFANAVGTETMKNIEIQYDLTDSGGDSAHYARLVVYRDSHKLGSALAFADLVEFKPELVKLMSDMGQNIVSKKLAENGAKLIEWLPAHKISVQKHNGVVFGARLTLSEKLPMPMFAAVAVYAADGRITGLALICPDSDKPHWQPVFQQILDSVILT